MIRYSCGCVNEIHEPSKILHSVQKCQSHLKKARDPAKLDGSYFRELGVLERDDELKSTSHVRELIEALGDIPRTIHNDMALEIGCGATPYGGAIKGAGWIYMGLDASPWATQWTRDRWGVTTFTLDWEKFGLTISFGFILCAHALEHMADAPGSIAKMSRYLAPGGTLWIVVPDCSDPVNPDHLWFFDHGTLRSTIEGAGLVIERLEVRSIVPHENFLYASARKADR